MQGKEPELSAEKPIVGPFLSCRLPAEAKQAAEKVDSGAIFLRSDFGRG